MEAAFFACQQIMHSSGRFFRDQLLGNVLPSSTMQYLRFLAPCCGRLQGVLKLLMTCQLRYLTTWPAVMISGLTSIILAFTILALSSWLFNESLKVIGIFFGADLCLTGVSMMLIAFMARLGTNVKSLLNLTSDLLLSCQPQIVGFLT
jgi:hypothetical protein